MYFVGCPVDTLLKCPEAAQSEGHEVKGNPNRPFSMKVYVHSTLSDHTFIEVGYSMESFRRIQVRDPLKFGPSSKVNTI